MKTLIRVLFPLRGINTSLKRLVLLYEADLRERNIIIPDPTIVGDMVEVTYDARSPELDDGD